MSNELDSPARVDDALARRIADQQARQSGRDSLPENGGGASTVKKLSNKGQRWMRWTHVYVSMFAFVIIGFFGVTGLLLNNPAWLCGTERVTTTVEGALPETVREGDEVEFLLVSEFLRSEHGIGGEVTNFDQQDNEGSINYTGPAFGASFRFDVVSLDYTGTISEEGFVNALRDLHTGSDTNIAWSWVIDISAGLLVVVSFSGLGMQLLMRRRRQRAMILLVLGAIVAVGLGWLTLV